MLETGPYIDYIVQELSSNIGKSVERDFTTSQLTILYNVMSITLNTYCVFWNVHWTNCLKGAY